MTSGGKSLSVHLANNGTARIPPDHISDLLPVLRQSFPKGRLEAFSAALQMCQC